MRPKPIYVVDIIGDIVAKTNAAVIAEIKTVYPLINAINYQYGPEQEITDTLAKMAKSTDQGAARFPLFALFMAFTEDKGAPVGVDGLEDLNIVIARRSNATDRTITRYATNFKPVLYPIYLEFLNQCYYDKRIDCQTPDQIPHTKIDFPNYNGGKDGNPFNDTVDAIQIKIKLKILLKNC